MPVDTKPSVVAQSRWTRTPISFGTGQAYSGVTLEKPKGKAVMIEANLGPDQVKNSRMLRHESIHALLGDAGSAASKDRSVRQAAAPIVNQLSQNGMSGYLDDEMPAYMGSFSDSPDEWTEGVGRDARSRYITAYSEALRKQNPAIADKYQRMSQDSSPGTLAGAVDIYPGAKYRAVPGGNSVKVVPHGPGRGR